ncbi:hypothetical protein SDRG_09526 [Saprolegnia diclina VS20]|uniref:Uncharacterized protein n=1 Tax=Saprolegnia diclina (strain VS20) TaxID=1156394 RepID=T0Q5A6_SAPDV|nr:hypothetical protein SDRG_09526 [Saprolegnia diclina VS20]EQC33004.1 hypothetical protein SDRG_09526 [Saprolegnia diclina VS20]|eukprot:XP_008613690.1 hypothetical protein SDRG_09526 [Saprolegnia diclina VS20]
MDADAVRRPVLRRGSILYAPLLHQRVHVDLDLVPEPLSLHDEAEAEPEERDESDMKATTKSVPITLSAPSPSQAESPSASNEARLIEALLGNNDRCEPSPVSDFASLHSRGLDPTSTYAQAKHRDHLHDYIKMSRHMVHKVKSGQSLDRTIARQQTEMTSAKHRSSIALANACVSAVSATLKSAPRPLGLDMAVQFLSPNGAALGGAHDDQLALRLNTKKHFFRLRAGPWAHDPCLPSDPVAIETSDQTRFLCAPAKLGSAVRLQPRAWSQDAPGLVTPEMYANYKWVLQPARRKRDASIVDKMLVLLTQVRQIGANSVLYCLGHDLHMHATTATYAMDHCSWMLQLPTRRPAPVRATKTKTRVPPVIYPLTRPQNRYRAWTATHEAALHAQSASDDARLEFQAQMETTFRDLASSETTTTTTTTIVDEATPALAPARAYCVRRVHSNTSELTDPERLQLLQVHNPNVYGRLAPHPATTTNTRSS